MVGKHHRPEEFVAKLRQVEVLVGQGMERIDGKHFERRLLALCRLSLNGGNRERTGHLIFCANGTFVRKADLGTFRSESPLPALRV